MTRQKKTPNLKATLPDLSPAEVKESAKRWKEQIYCEDASHQAIHLHAVMCEVAELKKRHSSSSIDLALQEIFRDGATRVRMKRISEIPKRKLKAASKIFKAAKASASMHLGDLGRVTQPFIDDMAGEFVLQFGAAR